MHTEEIRARLAARRFRSLLKLTGSGKFQTAPDLLAAAESYSGVSRVQLPADDPLLAGSHALLDRDFSAIWINRDRPMLNQLVDEAHEFGHLVMHPAETEYPDGIDLDNVVGYSKNQRDERDAHIFAAEFLLPLDQAKELFLSGSQPHDIAGRLILPRRLVIRQLVIAFTNDTWALDSSVSLVAIPDSWQLKAAESETPALAFGRSGTGRTTALIARCRYLVEDTGIPSATVLVVAEKIESAQHIRHMLMLEISAAMALIPVTTINQLAYDILVRFPESAGLDTGWETKIGGEGVQTAERMIERALAVLRMNPDAAASLRSRYEQVLVDNLDRFSSHEAELVSRIIPDSGKGLWAASQAGRIPDVVDRFPNLNKSPLAFQYRKSAVVGAFTHRFFPTGVRRDLLRRGPDQRCGGGTVTISVSGAREMLEEGIVEFVAKKLFDGYTLRDMVVLSSRTGSRDAALKAKIESRIKGPDNRKGEDRHLGDLLAIINLVFDHWSELSFARACMMPNYNIPLAELKEYQQRTANLRQAITNSGSPALCRLLSDVDQCQKSAVPKEALLTYLFDISDYLRKSDGAAGRSIRFLMNHLPTEPGRLPEFTSKVLLAHRIGEIELSERGEYLTDEPTFAELSKVDGRSWPIVIFTDSDLARLYRLASTSPYSDSGVTVNSSPELLAAAASDDHLLLCASSPSHGKLLEQAEKIAALVPGVMVNNWAARGGKKRTVESEVQLAPPEMNEVDRKLFAQCPRRLYYRKLLHTNVPGPDAVEQSARVDADSFPAKPADRALCQTCAYSAICPTELRSADIKAGL